MPKKIIYLFCGLFLLGSGIRAIDLWRSVDGSVREPWRECDIASIARNYYREDMNLFYPRIDWRGKGPGYVEMEFPIYPWLIALLYHAFGFHEELGRLLAYGFSIAAMVVFFRLARYLLPGSNALAASFFFTLSPLTIRISNSLQPEGLMFLCYLLAAYAFLRWLDSNSWTHYGIALCATALAILAKVNAAHIGLFLAILLFNKKGMQALRKLSVWLFALLSLLPSMVWYAHAHHLWLTYGNSLGISNEYHWIGADILANPKFLLKIGYLEAWYVWMPTGIIIAIWGIWERRMDRVVQCSLFWLAAISVYYLLAARTTGDLWAVYYHVVSVPPVALLFGAGGGSFFSHITVRKQRQSHWHPIVMAFTVLLVPSVLLFQIWHIIRDIHPDFMMGAYNCVRHFHPAIPDDALIVVSSIVCHDEDGYPVAPNAPYFFYWLDRKGFNICIEDLSTENLNAFARKGVHYFIGETWALREKYGSENDLRKDFMVLRECPSAILFDLTRSGKR